MNKSVLLFWANFWETGYRKSVLRTERPPVTSGSTTPSVSRRSSVNSTTSPDPTLSRVSLEVSQCVEARTDSVSGKAKGNSCKGKKN